MEDSGFKRVLKPYVTSFETSFAINAENIRELIPPKASEIRNQIAALLKNRLLCLKIDSAKRLGRSIIGKEKRLFWTVENLKELHKILFSI